MKKMLIILTLTALTMSLSFAQFTKETKSAGGTLGWSSHTYDGDAVSTTLMISPSVGYFVIDNVGVNVGLAMATVTPDGGDGVTSTAFGLGAKYYMNNMYAGGSYNSYNSGVEGDDAKANLLIEAGYLYGLSDNVFLDAGFDYTMGMGDNKAGGLFLGVGIVTFF